MKKVSSIILALLFVTSLLSFANYPVFAANTTTGGPIAHPDGVHGAPQPKGFTSTIRIRTHITGTGATGTTGANASGGSPTGGDPGGNPTGGNPTGGNPTGDPDDDDDDDGGGAAGNPTTVPLKVNPVVAE